MDELTPHANKKQICIYIYIYIYKKDLYIYIIYYIIFYVDKIYI